MEIWGYLLNFSQSLFGWLEPKSTYWQKRTLFVFMWKEIKLKDFPKLAYLLNKSPGCNVQHREYSQ